MKIEKNKVVSLTYTLKNGSAEGEVIEVCDVENALEFLFQSGNMLPEFEKNIEGLEAGSSYEFILTPEQAYGEVIQNAIVEVNKDIFVVDGEVRNDLLEVGKVIPMRDNDGNALNGKVAEIKDEVVVIDFNHQLAGQTLHFSGKIESVREATKQELHHGVGGHSCGGDCHCESEGLPKGSHKKQTGGCGSDCSCG